MYGCRCGNSCWICAAGFKKPVPDEPSCLSATGEEVVCEACFGALAIARRRHARTPPRIDGNPAHRLLNQPRVWKTVEAVTRILMYGFGDANEPEEIERLLRCAGLPLLEAPDVEKKERRAKREAELGELQRALPTKRYGVILADPPWRFEPYSRATGMDCAANSHYPTSGLEEIKALDVASIAAPDCVLFLWATVPMLPQAHEAMAAWGFKYNRTSRPGWLDRSGR